MKRKARGAQRPRHIEQIGEGASTAHRSDSPAQQFVQRFPSPGVDDDTDAPLLVLTTTGSEVHAGEIARALVERRLAACVHLDAIKSVYRWKGVIEEGQEWRLVVKTTRGRAVQVVQTIEAMHDYDVPAILVLSVAAATPAFAAWLVAETAAAEASPEG